MDLKTDGSAIHFEFNLNPEEIESFQNNIDGFMPVIMNISPVTNIPMLLGETENEEEPQLSLISN